MDPIRFGLQSVEWLKISIQSSTSSCFLLDWHQIAKNVYFNARVLKILKRKTVFYGLLSLSYIYIIKSNVVFFSINTPPTFTLYGHWLLVLLPQFFLYKFFVCFSFPTKRDFYWRRKKGFFSLLSMLFSFIIELFMRWSI